MEWEWKYKLRLELELFYSGEGEIRGVNGRASNEGSHEGSQSWRRPLLKVPTGDCESASASRITSRRRP